MQRMDKRDYDLSMAISPKARRAEDNEGLRSLLVHRLMDGWKAIARRAIKDEDRVMVYCEHCRHWSPVRTPDAIPTQWECGSCNRLYRMEFATYEEVEDANQA